jgi:hypothetical protein
LLGPRHIGCAHGQRQRHALAGQEARDESGEKPNHQHAGGDTATGRMRRCVCGCSDLDLGLLSLRVQRQIDLRRRFG